MGAQTLTGSVTLVREDRIGRRGDLKSSLIDAASGRIVYFARSRYCSDIDEIRTTLYDHVKQLPIGIVSVTELQLDGQRRVQTSGFYSTLHFLSTKKLWRTSEGERMRWKWANDGSMSVGRLLSQYCQSSKLFDKLIFIPQLVAHKTNQKLAQVEPAPASSTGVPRLNITLQRSLLPETSSWRRAPAFDSPLSFCAVASDPAPVDAEDKRSPPRPSATTETLHLVLLTMLQQDHLRLQKARDEAERENERSIEWELR
ncbi:hypothetical protein JCM1841_002643 [Sporobolomyces salmonicolor]